MFDIHTHLHFKDYDIDRDEVIRRAREASVEKMILVGTDLATSRAAVELAEQQEFLFASAGVHPHEYNDFRFSIEDLRAQEKQLRELAKHPKVVAIGECGLDYFVREEQGSENKEQQMISEEQKENQKEGFLAQMEIANERGLPLIIHTRPSAGSMDAYEDVFEILKAHEAKKLKAVLHCYQGDTEMTKQFLELPNAYFSFAGSVTYPVKKSLIGTKDDPAEVVKLIPMERIFVETDCPYLAPQPLRGTRNEPANVRFVAEWIARAKELSREYAENAIRELVEKTFFFR